MKLKLSEVEDIFLTLKNLFDTVPITHMGTIISFKIAKLIRNIQPDISAYDDIRAKLDDSYRDKVILDDHGKPKIFDGGTTHVRPEFLPKRIQELTDLANTETEIDINPTIRLSELAANFHISPSDCFKLMPIIIDDSDTFNEPILNDHIDHENHDTTE